MLIELTSEEQSFLINLVTEMHQDANTRQALGINPEDLLLKFIWNEEFDQREIGILQSLMQVQSEIHGRRSSTTNEKQSSTNAFIPQKTLQLVKSISDKLGANLLIDTASHSPELSPRNEGSTWIMTNSTEKPIG